jgi:serine/threonine protein kinase
MLDMWAIGVVLYKSLFKKYPFPGKTREEVVNSLINGSLEFPSEQKVSNQCKDLISKLLKKDNLKRIKMVEVLKHPWVIEK